MYLPELMPDVIACKGGYCGNWLVLTSKIRGAQQVVVGQVTAQSRPILDVPTRTAPMLPPPERTIVSVDPSRIDEMFEHVHFTVIMAGAHAMGARQ
jgi:hypothetical protein